MDPYLRNVDLYLVSRGGKLDENMVLMHWPHALRIGSAPAYEQWYLGPDDQRRAVLGKDYQRFEFLNEVSAPR
jgi:hypothetical protein